MNKQLNNLEMIFTNLIRFFEIVHKLSWFCQNSKRCEGSHSCLWNSRKKTPACSYWSNHIALRQSWSAAARTGPTLQSGGRCRGGAPSASRRHGNRFCCVSSEGIFPVEVWAQSRRETSPDVFRKNFQSFSVAAAG